MTKIRVEKLKMEDFGRLDEQKSMAYLGAYLLEKEKRELVNGLHSYSAFSNDRVIACAGVQELWDGRAACWALVAEQCRHEFLQLHNIVKRFLMVSPYQRVEAYVKHDFLAGHRWVKALGFEVESPRMKSFLPGGADASLYAIVRG